jgi:seryl-tRNA synthetase
MASYREDLKKVLAEGYSLKDAHKETKRRREEALKTEAEDLEKDLEAISAEIQSNIDAYTKATQAQADTVSVEQVKESQEDHSYMIYNEDGSLEVSSAPRGIWGKIKMTGGKAVEVAPKFGYRQTATRKCYVWKCCHLEHSIHIFNGSIKPISCPICGSSVA